MDDIAFRHYKLNIGKIDEQHLNILRLLKEIASYDTLYGNVNPEMLTLIYDEFIEHLAEEESYMKRINFPYMQWHLEAHKDLRKQLEQLIVLFESKTLTSYSISCFYDKVRNHVDYCDRQIAEFSATI